MVKRYLFVICLMPFLLLVSFVDNNIAGIPKIGIQANAEGGVLFPGEKQERTMRSSANNISGIYDAFPAQTRWMAEEGYWICDLYLLGNGEAYLQWELSNGTMCPLTDCYWTLAGDNLLITNGAGVKIQGSMALNNLKLQYEDEVVLMLLDDSASVLTKPMAGYWSLDRVNADGWIFDAADEGIYSWIIIYEDLTADYHWHDDSGKVYDEKGLTMERRYGALWHGCGNELWHMALFGNLGSETYYLTQAGDTLWLMECIDVDERETPMVNTNAYKPFSP